MRRVHQRQSQRRMGMVLKGFVTAGVICAALVPSRLQAQADHPMIGEVAPSFELNGLDGETYALEEARGKYVVIHFATTWCPFCNAEAPHLNQLSQAYESKGVQVFIVDVKEDRALVAKWAERFQFTFPVLLDTDGSVSARYAPEGVHPDLARDEVPLASNLILDPEGKIRFYSLLNTAHFDARLTELRRALDNFLMAD